MRIIIWNKIYIRGSIMKKIYKILAILLTVSLLLSLTFIVSGCEKGKTKAILLIHGICGGAFYDAETGDVVWAIDEISPEDITEMFNDPGFIDKLKLDENGEPLHNLRLADMDDDKGKYTMLTMFKPLYEELYENYSDEYDVIVWQYDWRLDNYQSAAKLEEFVESSGYEELILVTHSMGGNVVSQFMANSQDNMNKVKLFIPMSTPFFGSLDACYFMLDGLICNIEGQLNSIPTPEGRRDFKEDYKGLSSMVGIIKPMLLDLGKNLPSVYMLTPFEKYADDPVYAEGETPIKLGNDYLTHSGSHEYFSETAIAKKSNGELKPGFEKYNEYQVGHIVDGKHISEKVNTHYIVGSGIDTLYSITINPNNGKISSYLQYDQGDGIVSVYSGCAGNLITDDNVYVMEGSSHISITTDEQTVTTVNDIIADFLKK
jgi:pimeloyl-ACP methyl ester carboxylesterase